ncbi:MAG TPA: cytochrome c [Opitutaceae bacterium]|nr:cytochrome c [Opitutaceae bacterium]
MRSDSRHLAAFLALGLAALVAAPTAEENYKKHCTKCHGADGKAQTRLGKKSGAKDLSDKQAQAKMTDEEVFKTIKLGRKNSKGEEKMDAFGEDMPDKEITELVAYVRTLAK